MRKSVNQKSWFLLTYCISLGRLLTNPCLPEFSTHRIQSSMFCSMRSSTIWDTLHVKSWCLLQETQKSTARQSTKLHNDSVIKAPTAIFIWLRATKMTQKTESPTLFRNFGPASRDYKSPEGLGSFNQYMWRSFRPISKQMATSAIKIKDILREAPGLNRNLRTLAQLIYFFLNALR